VQHSTYFEKVSKLPEKSTSKSKMNCRREEKQSTWLLQRKKSGYNNNRQSSMDKSLILKIFFQYQYGEMEALMSTNRCLSKPHLLDLATNVST
jgi:hypothetical protein